MSQQTTNETGRILAKRERNRAEYLQSRQTQEAVLLRLGIGEKRILDAAAASAGLSRSAFAQLYLIPIAAALTEERINALTRLTTARTAALSTVLAALIDLEINKPAVDTLPSELDREVSLAFDDLFSIRRAPDEGPEADATQLGL